MNVEVIALCDAATESHGKLNILGAFDHIWARQEPATHPLCAIALRIRFARIEGGAHRIRVNFVDEDGHFVMPSLDQQFEVKIGPQQDSVIANIILYVQKLKLDKFGRYSIDVAIDGRQETSIPLYVKKLPNKQ